jgi:hypothetical protein
LAADGGLFITRRFIMKKPSPNPPERNTETSSISKPGTMFIVAPQVDTESLLANASESLASATVMLSDFATLLEGSKRNTVLGIAQIVMLGELAVNRALDNVDPQS